MTGEPIKPIDPRKALKKEIIAYLVSQGIKERDRWAKALKIIKEAADAVLVDTTAPAHEEIAHFFSKYLPQIPAEEHTRFNPIIARSFRSHHYLIVKEFARRYTEIVAAEWRADEEQAIKHIDKLKAQRDKFKEHYQRGVPGIPGEVIIYRDCICIEISAEHQADFNLLLPEEGEGFYEGKGVWKYPNVPEYLKIFCKSAMFEGCPVLYAK